MQNPIPDDDKLFLWYGWPAKGIKPYFQVGPLSDIHIIANLLHIASRTWTCTEPRFRFCWMNYAVIITTKLRHTSVILKKPGFLLEKLKTLTSSNCHRIWLFLLKICKCFLLNNVYKSVFEICFMFRSWGINKTVKNKCVETRSL